MDIPVKEGQLCTVEVTGLSHQGEGVGRREGFAVFVPAAIPGDVVEVEVISTKKKYARGLIRQLLQASDHRVQPLCSVADRCGGCQLQHMKYEAQLAWKQTLVADAFTRIGSLQAQVLPVLGMIDPWEYRNKGQFPVGRDEGGMCLGLFAPRSHHVVTFPYCHVQPEAINRALKIVEELGRKHNIAAYDEMRHQGTLRHIVIRAAEAENTLMVVLVSRESNWQHPAFFADIQRCVPQLKVLAVNYNPKRTNAVFGDRTVAVTENEKITETIGQCRFGISPRSFFQTNSLQTRVLYDEVRRHIPQTGSPYIWDLHCGTGTIGIYAAQGSGRVVGVEVIPEAVADARFNAATNGVQARFVQGRAEHEARALAEAEGIPDVVILDPPRKGCDPELLEVLIDLAVPRIVYVSCNPSTVARDAAVLTDHGYRLGPVQPVDMFPHTAHIEVVVVLS